MGSRDRRPGRSRTGVPPSPNTRLESGATAPVTEPSRSRSSDSTANLPNGATLSCRSRLRREAPSRIFCAWRPDVSSTRTRAVPRAAAIRLRTRPRCRRRHPLTRRPRRHRGRGFRHRGDAARRARGLRRRTRGHRGPNPRGNGHERRGAGAGAPGPRAFRGAARRPGQLRRRLARRFAHPGRALAGRRGAYQQSPVWLDHAAGLDHHPDDRPHRGAAGRSGAVLRHAGRGGRRQHRPAQAEGRTRRRAAPGHRHAGRPPRGGSRHRPGPLGEWLVFGAYDESDGYEPFERDAYQANARRQDRGFKRQSIGAKYSASPMADSRCACSRSTTTPRRTTPSP